MTIFKRNPFRPAPNVTLYQALYAHMRAAILSGELKGGLKLPSTRALAEQLNISRNTVLNAYRQLLAEGYLEGRGGSGTYVANLLPESLLTAPHPAAPQIARSSQAESPRLIFSKHATDQLAVPQPPSASKLPRPFMAEVPAFDALPYRIWSRLMIQCARRMPVSSYMYQSVIGYQPLREAIAAHITISRQVHCAPEQVMILPGSQGALDLAARMLVNDGDPVWMEDPGYIGARGALVGAGAKIIPIPVDREGLMIQTAIERAPQARVAYITPSHQFPLGVTMSLSRRLALLEWARRTNAYILEDDYDSEFRFTGHPLASLQGLDNAGRVIYIGTFSKVLFPSMRIGYMVLPRGLIDSFRRVRSMIDIHTPILEQTVLAEFIKGGHYARHLRRMRALYAERRKALLEATRGSPLQIDSPEAGIHCVGWLPQGMDDQLLADRAGDYNLAFIPLSTYSIEPLARKGLLLGYGGYGVDEIKSAARRLRNMLDSA
jgi:GntR family transcriptional regulator / MocR family aminotransferase